MKKNRVLYSCVLLMALLFVMLYSGRIVYITLYATLLMPVLSFVFAGISLWGLRVAQSVDRDFIVKQEEAEYILHIQNRSYFAHAHVRLIFIEDHFAMGISAKALALQIPPRGKETVSFPIYCRYRGVYEIGLQSLEVQDIMGLFSLKKTVRDRLEVVVHPRVVEINNFYLSMNLLSKAPSRHEIQEEDYSTVSDLRKYQPSDNFKKIHWKLTAKRNELIVKNFQSTALQSTAILLDTAYERGHPALVGLQISPHVRQEKLVLEDKIVEGLVAVVHYCLKKHLSVEMIYGDGLRAEASSIAEFNNLYVIAAQLNFSGQKPLAQIMEEYTNDQINYMNIIVLTADLEETLYSRIISASYFGHFVSLIYFARNNFSSYSDEILSRLRLAGVNCYKVDPGDQILDVLEM